MNNGILKRAFALTILITIAVYCGGLALHLKPWALGLMMWAYGIPTGYFVYALKILTDHRHLDYDDNIDHPEHPE